MSGTMTTGRGAGGRGATSMGMTNTTMGAKVPPPTISQSVSSADQLHQQQQQQQQHFRSLQRDSAANGSTGASGVNPGTWQDGAASAATQYQQYGAAPAYGIHHHHLHQPQGMHPFRSLQRGTTAQLPPVGVHTSHSHSGHFRSAAAANKAAAAANHQQQQQQQQQSDGSTDGTYANNEGERQLYAVTEL